VIDPSKSETPLVDAEAESSDEDEEDEGGEGEAKEDGEGQAEEASEDSDDDEEGEDDDDAMDEEESGIDKLRMQLHEVLKENGGDNAGTDTVIIAALDFAG